jgi:hypothetical protein
MVQGLISLAGTGMTLPLPQIPNETSVLFAKPKTANIYRPVDVLFYTYAAQHEFDV